MAKWRHTRNWYGNGAGGDYWKIYINDDITQVIYKPEGKETYSCRLTIWTCHSCLKQLELHKCESIAAAKQWWKSHENMYLN